MDTPLTDTPMTDAPAVVTPKPRASAKRPKPNAESSSSTANHEPAPVAAPTAAAAAPVTTATPILITVNPGSAKPLWRGAIHAPKPRAVDVYEAALGTGCACEVRNAIRSADGWHVIEGGRLSKTFAVKDRNDQQRNSLIPAYIMALDSQFRAMIDADRVTVIA